MTDAPDPRIAVVVEWFEIAHDNHPDTHPELAVEFLARLDELAAANDS